MSGSLRWMTSLAVASVAVTMGLGCAGAAGWQGDPVTHGGGYISVTNNHSDAVRVYRVENGMRVRLGMLMPMRSESYPLPAHIAASGGNLRLLIDPLGGGESFVTDPVLLGRDQVLQLHVAPGVTQSFYWLAGR